MRADRLLTLLMLLQARGRMTAKALAEKLEVSERTIYRDIEALSMAGVPVYAEAGRAGGFDLLDSYRTSLTGLNERELNALFMLSVPAPLARLGVSHDLQSALLKLSSALSGPKHREAAAVHQRVLLDWDAWEVVEEPVTSLRTIERALRQDRMLLIRYQPFYVMVLERLVEPYGLVAKAGEWHMVYARAGRLQVIRVAELLDVQESDKQFRRREAFDLQGFWGDWCSKQEQRRRGYPVTVLVSKELALELARYLPGGRHREIVRLESQMKSGQVGMQINFESLWDARSALLSLGGAVEVLEPLALRATMADYARQILQRY